VMRFVAVATAGRLVWSVAYLAWATASEAIGKPQPDS